MKNGYHFTNGRLVIKTRGAPLVKGAAHAIWYKNNRGRGRIVAAGMGVVDTAEYAAELYQSMVRWHVIHDPSWRPEE